MRAGICIARLSSAEPPKMILFPCSACRRRRRVMGRSWTGPAPKSACCRRPGTAPGARLSPVAGRRRENSFPAGSSLGVHPPGSANGTKHGFGRWLEASSRRLRHNDNPHSPTSWLKSAAACWPAPAAPTPKTNMLRRQGARQQNRVQIGEPAKARVVEREMEHRTAGACEIWPVGASKHADIGLARNCSAHLPPQNAPRRSCAHWQVTELTSVGDSRGPPADCADNPSTVRWPLV